MELWGAGPSPPEHGGGPCKTTTFYRYLSNLRASIRRPSPTGGRRALRPQSLCPRLHPHGPKTAKGKWYLQRLPRASHTRTASLHHLCRAAQIERPYLPRTPERFPQRLRIKRKQEQQRRRDTQKAQEARPLRTLPQSLHPGRNSLHHLSQETSGTEPRLSTQPQSPGHPAPYKGKEAQNSHEDCRRTDRIPSRI